ncbi:MAG TPA: HAMP domain-containing sensor histidine kinase, partial [Thermoanaerobaculia bacterium]|nr:HAMP domain-containing sensor histidine kinase [Thermoanaerobaculia bacterium]
GRGLTRPLRDLDLQTRTFARNQEEPTPEIVPTDDEIGVLVHSTIVMRDEIRAVQAQLRVTERRAATVELLAGVAHEVRNPLFGITSAAAALEQLLAGDARVAVHLELISRQSRRLARIMEEMLVLQRVPRRIASALPLRPVLESAAAAVRARLPRREPRIEVSPSTEVSLADADPDRIESVFSNLFENAILSSDAPVRICCRARRDEGEGVFAVIEVEDDGPGINPEIHGRVFEPFVSSRPGGTGIGLALCRQIVAEHGGTIRMSSRPGSTVFSVRLPAV